MRRMKTMMRCRSWRGDRVRRMSVFTVAKLPVSLSHSRLGCTDHRYLPTLYTHHAHSPTTKQSITAAAKTNDPTR